MGVLITAFPESLFAVGMVGLGSVLSGLPSLSSSGSQKFARPSESVSVPAVVTTVAAVSPIP